MTNIVSPLRPQVSNVDERTGTNRAPAEGSGGIRRMPAEGSGGIR
jgi:hypothetical protein